MSEEVSTYLPAGCSHKRGAYDGHWTGRTPALAAARTVTRRRCCQARCSSIGTQQWHLHLSRGAELSIRRRSWRRPAASRRSALNPATFLPSGQVPSLEEVQKRQLIASAAFDRRGGWANRTSPAPSEPRRHVAQRQGPRHRALAVALRPEPRGLRPATGRGQQRPLDAEHALCHTGDFVAQRKCWWGGVAIRPQTGAELYIGERKWGSPAFATKRDLTRDFAANGRVGGGRENNKPSFPARSVRSGERKVGVHRTSLRPANQPHPVPNGKVLWTEGKRW